MKKIIRTLTICLLVALLVAVNIAPCFAYTPEIDNILNSYKNYCESVLKTFKKQMASIGVDMYPEMFDTTYIDLGDDIVCLLDIAEVKASEDGFSITITPHDNAQLSAIQQTLEKQFSLLIKSVENDNIILSCSDDKTKIFTYSGYVDAFLSEDLGLIDNKSKEVQQNLNNFAKTAGLSPLAPADDLYYISQEYVGKLNDAASAASTKITEHFLIEKSATILSEGSSLMLIGLLGAIAIAEAVVIIKLKKK